MLQGSDGESARPFMLTPLRNVPLRDLSLACGECGFVLEWQGANPDGGAKGAKYRGEGTEVGAEREGKTSLDCLKVGG